MNAASERRLLKLHPKLAGKVRLLIDLLATRGYPFEVVQGLRTFAEQDALFAQGRTKPGKIVTRAKGGQSIHNYALAADICPFRNGTYDWNWRAAFLAINDAAEQVELNWGGDWKKFLDLPHVEMPDLTWRQCLTLYKQGELPAVWAKIK